MEFYKCYWFYCCCFSSSSTVVIGFSALVLLSFSQLPYGFQFIPALFLQLWRYCFSSVMLQLFLSALLSVGSGL